MCVDSFNFCRLSETQVLGEVAKSANFVQCDVRAAPARQTFSVFVGIWKRSRGGHGHEARSEIPSPIGVTSLHRNRCSAPPRRDVHQIEMPGREMIIGRLVYSTPSLQSQRCAPRTAADYRQRSVHQPTKKAIKRGEMNEEKLMRNIVEFRVSHVARMSFDLTPKELRIAWCFGLFQNERRENRKIDFLFSLPLRSLHFVYARCCVLLLRAGRGCVRAKLSSALESECFS